MCAASRFEFFFVDKEVVSFVYEAYHIRRLAVFKCIGPFVESQFAAPQVDLKFFKRLFITLNLLFVGEVDIESCLPVKLEEDEYHRCESPSLARASRLLP